MKFCSNCGKQVNEDANFCAQCGYALNSDDDAEEVEKEAESVSTSDAEGVAQSQSADENIGNAKKSYIATVLSAIITFFIRIGVQEEQVLYMNILENRYVIGIDRDLKGMFSLIPAVALLIAALVVSSDRKTDTQKKISIFVVNLVYIALSALFIWFDIPQEIFDF